MNSDTAAAPPREADPGSDPLLAWSSEPTPAVADYPPTGALPMPPQPWSAIIALAGTIVIMATLIVGALLIWTQLNRTGQQALSAPAGTEKPTPEPVPITVTATVVVPPATVTVTAAPPPPAVTTSVPPLATPQARIAEPIICSLSRKYPQMQPVDLTLTLVERGIYRSYDEAALVVDMVLADGCHGV